jgi:hypothetical protein
MMSMGSSFPPPQNPRPRAVAAGLLLALGLAGCGEGERGPYPMEAGRERERPARPVPPGATTRDRLGAPREPVATGLQWTLPAGWTEAPAGSMQLHAFRVAGPDGAEPGEVTISTAGGSVNDNVNRWRRQMGLAESSATELQGLPKRTLLGQPAVFVDLRGAYTAMGAEDALPGRRMLGLVLPRERQSLFVKFVGSESLVDAAQPAFERFVESLREADAEAPGAVGRRDPPPEPPARPQGLDPAKLAWDAPPGWKAAKATTTFRVIDFRIDGAPGVEAYLSHLQGTGGGVLDNVNLWRGNLGAPALDEKGIAALERLDVMGTKAVFVEQAGDFKPGMGAKPIPDALFYGVIVLLEHDALFLRLVGPRAEAAPLREAFRALARSLRLRA